MSEPWIIAPPASCTCIDEHHDLVWAVSPGGEQWPIIRDTEVTGLHTMPVGAAATTRVAPHENIGPLNPSWRLRITLASIRCGRPRQDGQPCRTHVGRPGVACHHHRDGGAS
jgi:hypothetical protein